MENNLSKALSKGVLAHLDGYLSGRLDGPSVSRWATEVLASSTAFESLLVEEALIALANLDHGSERLDTPNEDLEFFRECLLGKRSYQPPVEIRKRN